LVDAGVGKIKPNDFNEIIEKRDRGNAGITAPPQGLFLVEVTY
jgi:tRNA pseudouridine38-40 synthase